MGLISFLLKVVLIPIVLLLVVGFIVVLAIKMRRDRKKEDKELQQSFKPPPLQPWAPYTTLQQPAPVYAKRPGEVESGYVSVHT